MERGGERKRCGLCHWAGVCGGMTRVAPSALATAAAQERGCFLSFSGVEAATEPQGLNKYQNHGIRSRKGP